MNLLGEFGITERYTNYWIASVQVCTGSLTESTIDLHGYGHVPILRLDKGVAGVGQVGLDTYIEEQIENLHPSECSGVKSNWRGDAYSDFSFHPRRTESRVDVSAQSPGAEGSSTDLIRESQQILVQHKSRDCLGEVLYACMGEHWLK